MEACLGAKIGHVARRNRSNKLWGIHGGDHHPSMGFLGSLLLRLITQRVLCKDVGERQQYQVAATEAEEAKGLLAQRVAAFEGGERERRKPHCKQEQQNG